MSQQEINEVAECLAPLKNCYSPANDVGIQALAAHIVKGGKPYSLTIKVLSGGKFTYANARGNSGFEFNPKTWCFLTPPTEVGEVLNFIAFQPDPEKSETCYPVACVLKYADTMPEVPEKYTKVLDGCSPGDFSTRLHTMAKTDKYLDFVLGVCAENKSFNEYAARHEEECLETMDPPLLNEKNGMVDVGRMVNGQVVSFWVPKPEYVQIAPGVLVSKALLEKGCR